MNDPCRSRRTTFVLAGTRGDVQPLLGVARELGQHGTAVTVATHRCFEALVRDANLAFEPLPGDIPAAFATETGRRYMSAGRNTLRWASAFNDILATFWEPMLESFVDIAARTDALVVSSLTRPAALAATARSVPWIGAFLGPNYMSREFAHRLAPQWTLGALYNRASHLLVPLLLLPRSSSAATSAWVSRHALPKKPAAPAATLYGFSSSVVPPPPASAKKSWVTGYWFLDANDESELTTEVEALLAADDRPKIAFSFSSISADAATTQRLRDAILGSAERMSARAVVIGGWTDFSRARRKDVVVADALPHDRVFPRVDVVVHHGGAGSSAAALRAGVPSVVVPFCADQFFWADRLQRVGVAPSAVPASSARTDRLGEAIEAALAPAMRERARALGARIRAESGRETAARVIADALA